jgi:hypothetical protein
VPTGISLGTVAVSSLVLDADRVISVAVAKTHQRAHLTLSLKNFIGITPLERYGWMSRSNTDRVFLHQNDLRPEDFGRLYIDIPWSHSVASAAALALLAGLLLAVGLRRPVLGAAVGIAVPSHLALDLIVHARDIQLAPGIPEPMLGLGLYANAPLLAFALEFGFGVWCWWYYRGGRGLLAVIVLFNLANLSFFTPLIVGPEGMLAHRPTLIVTAILAQIVVTLTLVGLFARQPAGAPLAE